MMTIKVIRVDSRTGERRVLVPKHEVKVPDGPPLPLLSLALPPCECPRCRAGKGWPAST